MHCIVVISCLMIFQILSYLIDFSVVVPTCCMCLQVVTALTHILEGNTCSVVLRDCSPARSDSSYDMSDLLISDASQKLEGEDASIYAGYAPIWLRPPPSPPLGSTSSCTSSMFTGPSESSLEELSNDENKGKKPNDQGGIF